MASYFEFSDLHGARLQRGSKALMTLLAEQRKTPQEGFLLEDQNGFQSICIDCRREWFINYELYKKRLDIANTIQYRIQNQTTYKIYYVDSGLWQIGAKAGPSNPKGPDWQRESEGHARRHIEIYRGKSLFGSTLRQSERALSVCVNFQFFLWPAQQI